MLAFIFYSIIAVLMFLVWAYKRGLETGTCKNCSFPYKDHLHIMGKGINQNLVDKAWAECPSSKINTSENTSEECQHCGGTGRVTITPQTFVPFTLADKITDLLS